MPTRTHEVLIIGSGASGGWVAKEITERGIQVACVVAVAGGFAFNLLTTRPQDQAITRIIASRFEPNFPTELSFVASNYKSQQYSTFRSGCYWHELDLQEAPEVVLAERKFRRVRAFILDPDDLQNPAIAPWLDWLKAHATEKTEELNSRLGKTSGIRVFTR